MENGVCEEYIYDPTILNQLDWDEKKATFKNGISPTQPGDGLCMRPLCVSDYNHGVMDLLSQLTKIGEVSKEQFEARFKAMKSCPNTYFITVLEDTQTGEIIGCTTTVIEQKFIHSAGMRGRIEDVVVNENYRGRQLGKLLVQTGTLIGKYVGCYKMSLECSKTNVPFYETFGYDLASDLFMIQRYKD